MKLDRNGRNGAQNVPTRPAEMADTERKKCPTQSAKCADDGGRVDHRDAADWGQETFRWTPPPP
eukprot:2527366-Prymnesium_polylepis.1